MAGMDVTIAARGPDILGTMDEEITRIVEEGLVRNSIKLLKSTSVREFISKNGYVREAILNNSESINADIVIVCIGMRPNSEIAKEAGIEIDNTGAINVNQNLETNIPGIYSAGDCAMGISSSPRKASLYTSWNHGDQAKESSRRKYGRRECFVQRDRRNFRFEGL